MGGSIKRHLPHIPELLRLLRPRRFKLNPIDRRLSRCVTIADLRLAALKRAPRPVFDYVAGAADDEVLLRRQYDGWKRIELNPRALEDVSHVDASTTVFGQRIAFPLVLAPTGFARMVHTTGELAVASAADEAGVPYALSTMNTSSIEDVAAAGPGGMPWFQLYIWKERRYSEQFIERAARAGYRALMITIDTQVVGRRVRDLHNGFTIPPALSFNTFVQGILHPAWTFDFLTTDPPNFTALSATPKALATVASMFDPAVGWNDIKWVRDLWKGPLLIKGITRADEAKRAVEQYGVNGIIVSSHGARQLDRKTLPLEVLPRIVDAVGDHGEVLIDGGIMNGGDIVAAVAFGARAVMVGRAYLYGLMAGGERGVRLALNILQDETRRAMQLIGVTKMADLDRSYVSLRGS